MKKYFSYFIAIFFLQSVTAQIQFSPLETAEYCPLVNTTFTVTVPGYQPSVFGWTNSPVMVSANYPPIVVASSTTFTFIGNFQDKNIAQTFGVTYKRQSKPDTTEYKTFKKIKSLFYANPPTGGSSPCQPFFANQTSINAPICQVTNATVS